MIGTVSLNPAVDKYLRLARLERGCHLEVEEVVTSAGGKAGNVAGVLRALGEEVELVGFFGGFTGEFVLHRLAREGISLQAVTIASTTRTAFVMVEQDGTETEVVEPGGRVTAAELSELRARVRAVAARAQIMVLSGSVPPGCPDDVYVKLLEDCDGHCPVIVDTSRAWLRAVLRPHPGPHPFLIKPNRREAEAALGAPLDGLVSLQRGLEQFQRCGVTAPAISDGAAGIYALAEGCLWQAHPPIIQVVNSVGSGDAAVAGLATGMARGYAIGEMLRLAAACGAANALTKECGDVRPADVEQLLPQVRLEAARPALP